MIVANGKRPPALDVTPDGRHPEDFPIWPAVIHPLFARIVLYTRRNVGFWGSSVFTHLAYCLPRCPSRKYRNALSKRTGCVDPMLSDFRARSISFRAAAGVFALPAEIKAAASALESSGPFFFSMATTGEGWFCMVAVWLNWR